MNQRFKSILFMLVIQIMIIRDCVQIYGMNSTLLTFFLVFTKCSVRVIPIKSLTNEKTGVSGFMLIIRNFFPTLTCIGAGKLVVDQGVCVDV